MNQSRVPHNNLSFHRDIPPSYHNSIKWRPSTLDPVPRPRNFVTMDHPLISVYYRCPNVVELEFIFKSKWTYGGKTSLSPQKILIRIKAASREWSSHFLLDSGQLYMALKRTASGWHKIHNLQQLPALIHQGLNPSLSPEATTKKTVALFDLLVYA